MSRPKYDVFLAYNSQDDVAVRYVTAIDKQLRALRKKPWFAPRDSVRGRSGQANMADGIRESGCCALFFGPEALGRHQGRLELPTALRKAIYNTDYRVVPVLLPGFDDLEALPDEIADLTVEDLRNEFLNGELSPEGRKRILAFIAGRAPAELDETADTIESEVAGPPVPDTEAPAAERFRALLVGVSTYDHDDLITLRGPPNDLEELELALDELDMPPDGRWEVTTLSDPTKDQLAQAIEDFFGAGATEADTLLFYFSGHAIASHGSHLCARDSDPQRPGWTCITAQMLVDVVKSSPARSKVVVLDCCHAAPIVDEDNPYATLDDGTAVLFASHGLADDAVLESDPSPFTKSLVRALRDDQAYAAEQGLTIEALLDALEALGQRPRSNPGIARDIQLAVGAAPALAAQEPGLEHLVLEIDGSGVSAEEERILRQLAATLEALLAFAPEDEGIPNNIVAESIRVLADDLRRHVISARFDEELARLGRPGAAESLPVDLRFKDGEVRRRLADLPWEYIAMCRHNGEELGAQDAVRAPALSVQRIFPAAPTKSYHGSRSARAGGRIQRVALFSSLPPRSVVEREHLLTKVTVKRMQRAPFQMEVTAPADWRRFYSYRNDADVIILQVPVYLERGQPMVRWLSPSGAIDRSTPVETLVGALRQRPALTSLLIESVAEEAGAESALAVRRMAEHLALKLERPVLAVCHAAAYLKYLSDDDDEGPFVAHVVDHLHKGEQLDIAAHLARQELMTALSPHEPAIVGFPVVLSPDRRAAAGRLAGHPA